MDTLQAIYSFGVIGVGGGFHAHAKAQPKVVDYILANGAECEPLILKDVELMTHRAIEALEGL